MDKLCEQCGKVVEGSRNCFEHPICYECWPPLPAPLPQKSTKESMGEHSGLKYDQGKAMWGLLPFAALNEVVRVLTYGAKKYAPGNWRNVSPERYFDALMRHLSAYRMGEELDPETGFHHLTHVLSNALFLVALVVCKQRKPETLETILDQYAIAKSDEERQGGR